MSLVRSGAFNLTAADLSRALTSIGLQQQLAAAAESRADEIEVEAELSGRPVSTTIITGDDGVSIRVTSDGDASAFDDLSIVGEAP